MPTCCACERKVSDDPKSIDSDVYWGHVCEGCSKFACSLCWQDPDVGELFFVDDVMNDDCEWRCVECIVAKTQ